jgi:hypothetical protein
VSPSDAVAQDQGANTALPPPPPAAARAAMRVNVPPPPGDGRSAFATPHACRLCNIPAPDDDDDGGPQQMITLGSLDAPLAATMPPLMVQHTNKICPPGHYSYGYKEVNGVMWTKCSKCQPGKLLAKQPTSASTCKDCPKGQYTGDRGSVSCKRSVRCCTVPSSVSRAVTRRRWIQVRSRAIRTQC